MYERSYSSWPTSLIPLAAGLAVFGICGVLYLHEASLVEKSLRDTEFHRMEIRAQLYEKELQSVIMDLRVLGDGDGLRSYMASGQQADLDRAIHRAVFISRLQPNFDRIRYIDEHGREIARVDANGVVVPRDQLQNKADRPYFQKAMALAPGQVYIPAFDLNGEHGRIEQPLKPILRLATPVFDLAGLRRGVCVIDYLGTNLLTYPRQFAPQYQKRFRILNAQGYWLQAAQPEQEWGFLFPDRAGMTLARTDPDLWAQIVREPEGQTRDAGGLFTWYRVVPRDSAGGSPGTVVTDDDFLVMASDVSAGEWAALLANLREVFLIVAAILLLLVIVSWRFFYLHQRAQHERDRFFALTRDMLCIAGFDGYFKRVNHAWQDDLGYTMEEMISKPFLEFVHPEDRERTLQETSNLMKGRETVSFENRYRCKDGSYRWLMWNARALLDEQLIFASARDKTELRKHEQTLIKSRQMFQQLFENAPDAIVLVDHTGHIVRINTQAETLFGYTRAELIGQNIDRLMPERYRAGHGGHLAGYFAAPHVRATSAGLELYGTRKDGGEFPADIMLNSLETDEGLHALAIIRDITNRKQAEEEVKKLNEQLQNHAKQLEVANKELEAFSYSVSHDLRAPLRHVDGFVEMLSKHCAEKLDERGHRYLNIIADSARQMGALIDDLLVFSRMGRTEMRQTAIDMNALVQEAIEALQMDTKPRHICWKIDQLPEVKTDASMLRQVWINLISNAVKYTRLRDPAEIEIGCSEPTPEEDVFFIRDNGVGFDMQYVNKLFGVFQRLHRADEFEGTGIGLANVHRIISRHGGRAWAQGKIDGGATFFFSLPKKPTQPKE